MGRGLPPLWLRLASVARCLIGRLVGGGSVGWCEFARPVLGPDGCGRFGGLVVLDGWPAGVSDRGGPGSSLLGRVCAGCVRSVPVTGAAVSLMSGAGYRATVHASDGVVAQLADLDSELGE